MLGLKEGIVKLVEYDPKWKDLYEKEKKLILESIDDVVIDIQHIGSTAIPGMQAKPIIDIMIGLKSIALKKKYENKLNDLGYEFEGWNTEESTNIIYRNFFKKIKNNYRTHHLHLFIVNSEIWNKHINFRDYLIDNKETASEYVSLKYELMRKFPKDRKNYTDAKSKFINMIVDKVKKEGL